MGARGAFALAGWFDIVLVFTHRTANSEGIREADNALQDAKVAALFEAIVKALGRLEVLDFAPRGIEGGQVENRIEMRADFCVCHCLLGARHALFDDGKGTSKSTVRDISEEALPLKIQLLRIAYYEFFTHEGVPSGCSLMLYQFRKITRKHD